MATAAGIAAVVGAGSSIMEAKKGRKAARISRREERKARQVENAVSAVENQRAIQQRVATQRIEAANQIQGAEASGVSGSSSLMTSVGSGQSGAAGDIGFAKARLGGAQGASNIRSAGAAKAGRAQEQGSVFGSVASASSLFTNEKNNTGLGKTVGLI